MTTERFDTLDSKPDVSLRMDTDPENRAPVMLSSTRKKYESGIDSVSRTSSRYDQD